MNKASEVRAPRAALVPRRGWRCRGVTPGLTSPPPPRQVAAFDLVAGVLLWRRDVATKGLLNVVGAPHISESATSVAQRSWSTTPRRRMISDGEQMVAVLDPMPYVPYDPASGEPPRQIKLDDKRAASKLPQRRLPPQVLGVGAYVPLRHVDVSKLAARLRAHPEIWDADVAARDNAVLQGRENNMARFKPGCASAHFVFSDQGANACFQFPWWDEWKDVLQPILDEILGWYGVPVEERAHRAVRLQMARMAPGGKILKHSDKGGWATGLHRIHVPVITNPDVQFLMMADAEGNFVPLHVAPGDVFEINNVIPHQARARVRLRHRAARADAAGARRGLLRRCTTAWRRSGCTCCLTLARLRWSARNSSAAKSVRTRTSTASSAEHVMHGRPAACHVTHASMSEPLSCQRRAGVVYVRRRERQNGLWFQPKPPPD